MPCSSPPRCTTPVMSCYGSSSQDSGTLTCMHGPLRRATTSHTHAGLDGPTSLAPATLLPCMLPPAITTPRCATSEGPRAAHVTTGTASATQRSCSAASAHTELGLLRRSLNGVRWPGAPSLALWWGSSVRCWPASTRGFTGGLARVASTDSPLSSSAGCRCRPRQACTMLPTIIPLW
jgi:hypothetical protein